MSKIVLGTELDGCRTESQISKRSVSFFASVRWMTVIAAHTCMVQSLSDPELNFEINADGTQCVAGMPRRGDSENDFCVYGRSDLWGAGTAGARRNGSTTDFPLRGKRNLPAKHTAPLIPARTA